MGKKGESQTRRTELPQGQVKNLGCRECLLAPPSLIENEAVGSLSAFTPNHPEERGVAPIPFARDAGTIETFCRSVFPDVSQKKSPIPAHSGWGFSM